MRCRPSLFALSLAAACLLSSCAHDESAYAVAHLRDGDDPSEQVAGVRVRVDGDPDLALPGHAASDVTPVRVVIDNEGDEPLRIRYRELVLVEASGEQRVALPPLKTDGEPLGVRNAFGSTRFSLAPGYEPFYEALDRWDGPFDTDPYYALTYYPRWTEPLPTTEMIARALPEGVLEPGGSVDGLLYFEGISPLDDHATLVAELVNAESGAVMGTVRVPFRAAADHEPFALRQ